MTLFRRLRLQLILIMLLAGLSVHTASATGGVTLTVDANAAARRAISPLIYGMNFADPALAAELRLPVDRWGGNAVTRYNYLNDTSNHASDWYFENIPNDNSNPGALPNGSASDQFVAQDRSTGTQSIITMPLIGWTPKNPRVKLCGFSVAKYGPQQSVDPWDTDCGNGVNTSGQNITGNDPTDTSTAIDLSFDAGWVAHLISQFGTAANGGVQFYALDNEPMLWNSTHRDVHPTPTSYDEMKTRALQYAPAIKQADPSAKIIGPVLWGWDAYFYSALDEAPGGAWWNDPLDRNAHGGTPFLDWYLQQMKAYQDSHNNTRVLDYLDLHFYPQENGVSSSSPGDAATQALRLRSTRALWDPTYVDESWINTPVRLIPRMHDWVTNDYPGTKISLSEYNWGALGDINGALAQADVLGIFGREGLDMATIWGTPSSTQPGAYAFRMYRNYDGAGSQFGDSGVTASSSDQSQLAVYGAVRSSDGALTLMVINKTGSNLTSALNLSNFLPGSTAKVYRYSAANLNAIVRQADQAVTGSGFSATYPANSITLVVIPPGTTVARIDSIGIYRAGTFYLRLHNSTGSADLSVAFSAGTKPYPIVGDWTGAGFDTVGVFDQNNGQFTLCTANVTATCAGAGNQKALVLGVPNDQPLSGRWSLGAAGAGVGVFRPSNGLIYLKNALISGYADFTMVLGIPGDVGLAGDWNGKGFDSPGVYRPGNSTFYLSNQVKNGSVTGDYQVTYGLGGDAPVVGDWVAQGHDGVGLFRQSNGYTYLKNALTTGYADDSFTYGIAGDIPVAGHWQLTYPPAPPPSVLIRPTTAPLGTQNAGSIGSDAPIGD